MAPAELEGFLLDHPLVGDVGVVGFADEYSGEVPLAFVALSEEAKKSGKKEDEMRKEICQVSLSSDFSMVNHLNRTWCSLSRTIRLSTSGWRVAWFL